MGESQQSDVTTAAYLGFAKEEKKSKQSAIHSPNIRNHHKENIKGKGKGKGKAMFSTQE